MNLSLQVDRPAGPYYPDEVVHVVIIVTEKEETLIQEIYAGLVQLERYLCYGQKPAYTPSHIASHWATDERWVIREILEAGRIIPRSFQKTYRYDWRIPQNIAPSYAGHTNQIHWLVKVAAVSASGQVISQEVELPVIVPPPGLRTQPGEYGEVDHPAFAWMWFGLPTLEFVEGDTIVGQLHVEPRQNFGVNSVWMELLREECVFRGGGIRHVVVERKVQLAMVTDFYLGTPVQYRFALPTPRQGCPSYETACSRAKKILKASLHRRSQNDFTVQQEVFIYGGPAKATS